MELTYTERMSIGLRPAECGAADRKEIMVPMRDGTMLRTLVYTPDTEGPWPALLSRSPYPKNQEIYDYQGRIFSERGYAFVLQYCRGTGGSGGKWEPFVNEQNDGEDTLKWLEEQSFASCVGLYGFSYVAYTQWVLLDRLTPKVKTAYIVHFGTDRYRQMYADGLFRHDIYTPWAMDNNDDGIKLPYEKSLEAGMYRPHIKADRDVFGMDLPWYREWISHTDYDDDFWKKSFWEDLKSIPGKTDIPVCLCCGWYDHHFGGMMEAWSGLSDQAKEHSRLVIGPWVHHKQGCIEGKDTSDAFSGRFHGYEAALGWMDRCLKGGQLPEKEAWLYEVGQGWRKMDTWPAKTGTKQLFFNDRALVDRSSEEETARSYVYDPSDVIRTHGAECMCYAPLSERGSVLQPQADCRSDVLSFVSGTLEDDLTVAGKAKVYLRVKSDAEDTAFIVRLMEVLPDGRAYNIRTGASTLRYRNGVGKAVPYTPGEPVVLEYSLWDICWRLRRGARIRIDVASSSFPEYHIHPNTAQPWALAADTRRAVQTVFSGGTDGSRLELPVG